MQKGCDHTERFEKLYRQLFENICEYSAKKGENTELTTHFPVVGKYYESSDTLRFMLVGRCTNGWESQLKDSVQSMKVDEYVEKALFFIKEDRETASKWREDAKNPVDKEKKPYNIRKSAFWRSAEHIWVKLNNQETQTPEWFEHIIWLNLFPVAPKKEGNASNKLLFKQAETAVGLFNEAILFFRPTHVLVESGWDWFSYSDSNSDSKHEYEFIKGVKRSTPRDDSYIDAQFIYAETQSRIVIAERPEGKPDSEYCKRVIEAFQAMRTQ